MSELREGDRLPTVGGRVHGIVGWDPLAVQCDDCLVRRVYRPQQ